MSDNDLPNVAVDGALHRLIPDRYPPVSLFYFARSQRELEVMAELEGYTDDQRRNERGDINLVPSCQRRNRSAIRSVMSAFTHSGYPSQFSTGQFGVYYCAADLATALAEASEHLTRFLAASMEPATQISLCEIRVNCAPGVTFPVIEATGRTSPGSVDPRRAEATHTLGQTLRDQGEYGLQFTRVGRPSGQCLAIFRPDALDTVDQGRRFNLIWDGTRITHQAELRTV